MAVAAGLIGLLLRFWHLGTVNDRGFLERGHISIILLAVLSAVFLAAALWLCLSLKQGAKFGFNFPASPVGGVGTALAALGILFNSLQALGTGGDVLLTVTGLLGILAAAAMVFAGYCRWMGKHPSMIFHAAGSIWLMLRLICLYRTWSADPQVEDYCFQLLAMICAMLAAYHRATFDANFGKREWYAFFSMAAVYFCILAIPGESSTLLFACLGVWLLTDTCSLRPNPRRRRERKNEAA